MRLELAGFIPVLNLGVSVLYVRVAMIRRTAPSPPPSPQAPTLTLPSLSRILLWSIRRRKAPAAPQESSPTVVRVPKEPVKASAHHLECSSGSELQTHPRIVDAHPECRNSDVIKHQDLFVCLNGVDTKRLLLLARRRVFQKVELLGGNAIIDERWTCIIRKHETRRGAVYRTSITYQGTPARCTLPDPQRPVALEEARGVPGLMTVVSRQ